MPVVAGWEVRQGKLYRSYRFPDYVHSSRL
jgi:pterin-4a-carbinolamine dehydratase